MSERSSSQRPRTSIFRDSKLNASIIETARSDFYEPRRRAMTNQQYRDARTEGLDMDTIARNVEALKQKELAGKPPFGGKKTHTYKNKEYVVRTGEKGGRFILIGSKEKKKVYI